MNTELEEKILKLQGTFTTLTIAKHVIGKDGTTRDVNPTLYALRMKHPQKVKKVNDSPPIWAINEINL